MKEKTDLQFDPKEIASLEVGWLELHDQLKYNLDKTQLTEVFAKLYATQFVVQVGKC